MEYQITWKIEVEAGSFEEAVKIALEIQRDPNSIATQFEVRDASGTIREFDMVWTTTSRQRAKSRKELLNTL